MMRHSLLSLTIAAATLAIALPANAAKKPAAKPQTVPLRPSNNGTTPAAPNYSSGGDAAALRSHVAEVRAEAKSTQDALDAFIAARHTEFEAQDSITALVKLVDDDKKNFENLMAPHRKNLRAADHPYDLASQEIDAARKKLEEARASKDVKEISYRRSEVDRMDAILKKGDAGILDQNPDCKTAKAKLDADSAKLADARSKFPDFLAANPDYAALKLAAQNAKTRLDATLGTADASK
jgi:hypothetical protein